MTLTERLNETEGEHGNYAYRVEVWRSDTLAVANLRVRLLVYRVRERSFLFWNWTTREEVYRDTNVTGANGVGDEFRDAVEHAKSVAERFENERVAAEGASV